MLLDFYKGTTTIILYNLIRTLAHVGNPDGRTNVQPTIQLLKTHRAWMTRGGASEKKKKKKKKKKTVYHRELVQTGR